MKKNDFLMHNRKLSLDCGFSKLPTTIKSPQSSLFYNQSTEDQNGQNLRCEEPTEGELHKDKSEMKMRIFQEILLKQDRVINMLMLNQSANSEGRKEQWKEDQERLEAQIKSLTAANQQLQQNVSFLSQARQEDLRTIYNLEDRLKRLEYLVGSSAQQREGHQAGFAVRSTSIDQQQLILGINKHMLGVNQSHSGALDRVRSFVSPPKNRLNNV